MVGDQLTIVKRGNWNGWRNTEDGFLKLVGGILERRQTGENKLWEKIKERHRGKKKGM